MHPAKAKAVYSSLSAASRGRPAQAAAQRKAAQTPTLGELPAVIQIVYLADHGAPGA
jgi:hypothetical protein